MLSFHVIAISALFWACLALVAYVYVLYPLLIWSLCRIFGRRREALEVGDDKELPTVSLVLAAYNEEAVIENRLHNALAIDYPPDKLVEIVVGSDGSTDGTAEIVRRFTDRGVRLLNFAQNRGKATVLNAAMIELSGEIVVLSDANTFTDPMAVRKLVRWFREPRVGAVCGRLVLTDPRTGCNADGLYWKYETFLKRCEGRLGALLGANGAIYAVRKNLYVPIPGDTIIDDFVIPLLVRLKTGHSLVYDCEAVAREETAPNVRSEFHRRSRIGAGGFQSITRLWRLLDPRHGWVAFTFLSHKILRWLCPFFLIGLLICNLALWNQSPYELALLGQCGFYLLALLAAWIPARFTLLKPLRLTTMFVSMNMALLVGFWRWLRGRQQGTWKRTARLAEINGAAQCRLP